MNTILVISLIAFFILIIIVVCLYKGNELFGSGSRKVDGYYIIEWKAPANVTPDTTYSITITDSKGATVVSEKDLKTTQYLFKTGEWNTEYKYTVGASNSMGESPTTSIVQTTGTGPFPSVKDIFLASQTQDASGSWVTNIKLAAGSAFPAIPLVGVVYDPSIKSQQDLSMIKTSDNPNGTTTVGLTGEYTSASGLTCKIFRDNDNKLEVKYINDFYGITDAGIDGEIAGFIIDNGSVDNPESNPDCKTLGGSFRLNDGDKFQVTISFTNEYGTTSMTKNFQITQTKLSSPNELKINFLGKS